MNETEWLAQRFDEHRPGLTAVAYRMLGSTSDADDAVQEAWLRLSRSDTDSIEHLGRWLTTVLSRVCLNILQARRSRPEVPLGHDVLEPIANLAAPSDPIDEALLAESIGLALLIVLDTLSPAERVAFVLQDMFGVPFDDIAPIVGRNPPAARQLASRARRRIRHGDVRGQTSRLEQAKFVDAFLSAARAGEFSELLAVLDPDVVLRADDAAMRIGVAREIRGASDVAEFSRRARGAQPGLLDGTPVAVWMAAGRPRVLYIFTIRHGRIVCIDLIADPERLRELNLAIHPTGPRVPNRG